MSVALHLSSRPMASRPKRACSLASIILTSRASSLSYGRSHAGALSAANICSGFAATGLVPFNPQHVLDALDIGKMITLPSSSHGPWTAKTSHSTQEVQHQMHLIKHLIDRHSQSLPNQAIHQLAKACKTTMHEVIMLRERVQDLDTANYHQKRKREAVRSYISQGGILTGAEGQQLVQETEKLHEIREPRKRAPSQCSNCGAVGHTLIRCFSK